MLCVKVNLGAHLPLERHAYTWMTLYYYATCRRQSRGAPFIKFGTLGPIIFGFPIWTWMVHDFTLEPIRKWLGANCHLGTHFGTLGTSFTKFGTSFIKFGTSDLIVSETPIWTWMIHDFILEPIRKWLGVDPYLGTHFGTFGTSFIKFGTSFIKFGTSDPIVSESSI